MKGTVSPDAHSAMVDAQTRGIAMASRTGRTEGIGRARSIGLALALLVAAGPREARAQGFSAGCDLPFAAIALKHPIDGTCGADGKGKSPAKVAESRAKNDFCAKGPALELVFQTFVQLQKAVDESNIPFGSSRKLPVDRSPLRGLKIDDEVCADGCGEGTLVKLVTFIREAHFANVRAGEAVNCGQPGRDSNDIHIALAESPDEEDLCNTVTAEMSPHFRPKEWSKIPGLELRRPVRITGALFFDGSHVPCRGGKRPNPQRASLWEIHPVYAVDVCRNLSVKACPAEQETVWIPFHKWIANPLEDEVTDEEVGGPQ